MPRPYDRSYDLNIRVKIPGLHWILLDRTLLAAYISSDLQVENLITQILNHMWKSHMDSWLICNPPENPSAFASLPFQKYWISQKKLYMASSSRVNTYNILRLRRWWEICRWSVPFGFRKCTEVSKRWHQAVQTVSLSSGAHAWWKFVLILRLWGNKTHCMSQNQASSLGTSTNGFQ